MNNKTRLKRLNALHYMLINHKKIFKEEKIIFDINSWATKKCDPATAKEFVKKAGKQVRSKELCGSAACALGSAALYPPFMKKGLKMEADYVSSQEKDDGGINIFEYQAEFEPSFRGNTGLGAGKAFFGIEAWEADRIFMPDSYHTPPTAKDVAKRVKEIIKDYT